MFKAQYFMANSKKKKNSPITIIVWVLGRVEKMPKKGAKKGNKIFFCFKQISKCDRFSTCIFQGLFKHIVFISVALVIGYFRFFHRPDFFRPVPYLINKKKHLNPLNYHSLKVAKFYNENESARTKKNYRGEAPKFDQDFANYPF